VQEKCVGAVRSALQVAIPGRTAGFSATEISGFAESAAEPRSKFEFQLNFKYTSGTSQAPSFTGQDVGMLINGAKDFIKREASPPGSEDLRDHDIAVPESLFSVQNNVAESTGSSHVFDGTLVIQVNATSHVIETELKEVAKQQISLPVDGVNGLISGDAAVAARYDGCSLTQTKFEENKKIEFSFEVNAGSNSEANVLTDTSALANSVKSFLIAGPIADVVSIDIAITTSPSNAGLDHTIVALFEAKSNDPAAIAKIASWESKADEFKTYLGGSFKSVVVKSVALAIVDSPMSIATASTASTGATSTGATSTGATSTGATSTGATSTGATSTGATSTGATSTGATSTGATSAGATSAGATSAGAL